MLSVLGAAVMLLRSAFFEILASMLPVEFTLDKFRLSNESRYEIALISCQVLADVTLLADFCRLLRVGHHVLASFQLLPQAQDALHPQ